MSQATVRVLYVNPPPLGKRFGSIKTDDPGLQRISMPYSELANFQRGGVYTIEYTTTDQGYHNFVALLSENKPIATPLRAPPPGRPRAPARAPQNSYQATDKDPRQIFVTGVVGRAMGSGKFNADDLKMLTKWAADAYDSVLSPTPRLPIQPPQPMREQTRQPSPYNGRQGAEPAGPRDEIPPYGDYPNDDPFPEEDDHNPPF